MKILWLVLGLAAVLTGCAAPGPGIRVVQHAEGVPPSVVPARP